MNNQNLIPEKRLKQKQARRSIHRWCVVNAGYLGLLVLGGIAIIICASRPSSRLNPENIKADVARSNATLVSLREQSALLKARLQSDQDVSRSPDWSILLKALSNSLGDDVFLTRVDCGEDQSAAKSVVVVPEKFHISGLGRSQQSVTQFVLKLERLDFFSRVRLVQTTPQVAHGCDCIGFDLLCDLDPSQGGQP